MRQITIELTEAEYKAFEYTAYSPEEWVQNLATDRSNRAKIEVSNIYIAAKNANNEAISAVGVDAQVLAAFEEGIVQTAKETEDAYLGGAG